MLLGLIISLAKGGKKPPTPPSPPVVERTMYQITLLKSSVGQGYNDEYGGPDQYVVVQVNEKNILKTSVYS